MKTGFSLYLGSGYQKNKEVIEKAARVGMEYVFTSLHIPEEKVSDYPQEVKRMMDLCKLHNLKVMVDVSNNTLTKLGLGTLFELQDWGFTHLRIDYGVSIEEMAELSKQFYIVLNTSTITDSELAQLANLKVDFSRFLACHNFYPKPLTGISLELCRERNLFVKKYGIETMGFVPGDKDLRGPVFKGLPTVEDHRDQDVITSMVECAITGACDVVCIGDVDCTDETYRKMGLLKSGIVEIRVQLEEEYHYLTKMIHTDRADYSEHFFRSVESRQSFYKTPVGTIKERTVGALCVSNQRYGRYEGELEIMRKKHEADERINVVGHVLDEDLDLFLTLVNRFSLQLLLV